jgi:signal transduction histidine kinase
MTTLARVTAWLTAGDARPGTAAPPVLPLLSQRVTALARGHPVAADAVLAAAVAGLSVNALSGGGNGRTAVLAVFVTGLALPLIWRRRHPAGVFATVCAVALAQWLYAQRVLGSFAILLALYSVARHAPRRVTLAAALAAGVVGAVAATADGRNWAQFLAVLTAMIAAPVFLGSYLRTRQAYLSALEERAKRLEYERDQQAQIAAAAERASIAREMHDIVAHSLAVIITMASSGASLTCPVPRCGWRGGTWWRSVPRSCRCRGRVRRPAGAVLRRWRHGWSLP